MNAFAGDAFGVVFLAALSWIVYHMVSHECKNMTQYCLMLFGMMCFVQSLFDTVTLMSMVGGRTVEHRTISTEFSNDGKSRTQNITLQQEAHPFFEFDMGIRYNMQSAVRAISPALMGVAAYLSYWSYGCFPSGLLDPMGA